MVPYPYPTTGAEGVSGNERFGLWSYSFPNVPILEFEYVVPPFRASQDSLAREEPGL